MHDTREIGGPGDTPGALLGPGDRVDFERRYLRLRLTLLAAPPLVLAAMGPVAAGIALLIAVGVVLSCGLSWYLAYSRPALLLRVQLALRLLDVVLLAYLLLLYHSLLHNAYYDFVYLLFVVAATATHGRRGTVVLAGASSVAVLAGRLQLVHAGVLPFAVRHLTDSVFYALFFVITGLAVAFLMRKSSETVRLREQVWRAVLTNVADGLITLDAQGRIVLINPAAERIWGYSSAQIVGQPIALLLDAAGAEEALVPSTGAEASTDGGAGRLHEVIGRRSSGETFPLEITLSTLHLDGAPLVIGTVRDISARRRAEDERAALLASEQAARREAEQAVHLRDDVLGTVSHDLKNPLTAITTWTQLLQRRSQGPSGVSPQQVAEGLARIEHNVGRMARLLNELLDVAQVQAGRPLALQREPTELVALSRRVAAEHQQASEHHHIEVETTAPEIIGLWDSFRLERVLGNLLSNAIKYSPDGGAISLVVREDGAWGIAEVRDQGVGIPQADLPRIFERYQRAGNVGSARGTGIGLAVVRQIVDQHGGHIAVHSREGQGTVFSIRLPLVPPPEESTGPSGS